jgi:isoleucyl-tRNA synthetase
MKIFPILDTKQSIDVSEKKILEFWKKENIFEKTVASRSPLHEFVFFDGPPFATGTPHYGHILAGTLKDAIPRYFTMKGYRVERKWGWDCHGVPVEFQVEKEHRIGGKPEIEKMGVGKFNELCRNVVMRCADQWEETVERMGRFVDFKDDYRTMDPEYMESVWWVFSELWKKNLIYEGEKVVAYSPKLGSPLSNFEANLNYKNIDDPAVTVKLELIDEQKTYFLAWTTTPWTLPSNLALCVNPILEYVKIRNEEAQESYWVGRGVLENLGFTQNGEYTEFYSEENSVLGEKLVGKKYTPLFSFFKDHKNAFQVLGDDFVGESEGTGIVHMAPTGEDDARILTAAKIPLVYPFDDHGFFDDTIPELQGKYFRDDPEVEGSAKKNVNTWVLEHLGKNLFHRSQIRHSYPHCWRTDCALMYRGVRTWFVNIQKIKDQMVGQNQNINWMPSHLRDGRFGKLLKGAPDWAISRNRFWGCPIPVWRCEDCGHIEVIHSRKILEEKCGQSIGDLHKHFVDNLVWDCEKCNGTMRRIPEVLDCWFESGAMPYASVHYPFSCNSHENHKEFFNRTNTFLENERQGLEFKSADFIAEGLDQTRGWFYTLHVLGCALFGKNIFNNVITNGIVLAEDGEKMSKSKKNYPDPNLVFQKYGADAMRFYLLSSPVARGENLRFSEKGVDEVLKSVLLPLRSAYQFFSTYANIDQWKPTKFLFLRHGEGDHNLQKIYSGNVDNEHHLTKEGKKQVKNTAQKLPKFDVLYASPFHRTRETAEILKQETAFRGEIFIEKRIQELSFGDLEGTPFATIRKRLANETTEPVEKVQKRMKSFFDEMTQTHQGKTICVVSHGDPIRSIEATLNDIKEPEEYLHIPMTQTATYKIFFALPHPQTELDRWILSELQTLLSQYRKRFDSFDLEGALRCIPPFLDTLNNWYLRRSRRRFWAETMTAEKYSGYETLHHVLVTLSKIIAPVCPFLAEELFKNLTDGESVHLEFFPFPLKRWIDKKVEKKVSLSREIVSLAASIRAHAKIKLRQPLAKLQFLSLENIDLDLDIIREEANVKEVEVLKSTKGVAEKIIRVNAKVVGPRLGGKVQELIRAGKEGKFEDLGNGKVNIAGEVLSSGEYEAGFLCREGIQAESTARTIVMLDTEINEELHTEGLAREIIRTLQEFRKEKGFHISDRITVSYITDSPILKKTFQLFGTMIADEVLATAIIHGEMTKDMEIDARDIDGEKIIFDIDRDK